MSTATATPLPSHPPGERTWVLDDTRAPALLDADLVGGKALRLVELPAPSTWPCPPSSS